VLGKLDVALLLARGHETLRGVDEEFREIAACWLEEVRKELLQRWPPEPDTQRLTNLVTFNYTRKFNPLSFSGEKKLASFSFFEVGLLFKQMVKLGLAAT
jgi:hypothetical protein